MSLSEQIQRVDGSQNEILKTILKAFGVTIGSEKIDGIASLAKVAANLKENGVLANDTKTAFGLGTDAAVNDVLLKAKSLIDAAQNTANSAPKIAFGSYVGTGKYGKSYPNSITSDFPIKLLSVYALRTSTEDIVLMSNYSSGSYPARYIMPMDIVLTEYDYNLTFGINKTFAGACTKRSSDYKTFYWYNEYTESSDGDLQFNRRGTTYFYVLFG